jgi:ABC-type multidrug transport system ATPase subunit
MHFLQVTHVHIGAAGGGLHDLDFSAHEGERISLFGPSRSGKTLLLKLLSGKISPDEGQVFLQGHPVRILRRKVGFAPESCITSRLTPHQLLNLALRPGEISPSQRAARLAEMLSVTGLYPQRDRPVRELSDTDKSALKIALSFIRHPRLVLLDNWMAQLPDPLRENLYDYMDDLQARQGIVVVLAATRSEDAERANSVAILDNGELLAFDDPEILLKKYAPDAVTVEACDAADVQKTLRGIFDVEISQMRNEIRFRAADAQSQAARLLRHPSGGVRTIWLRRASLWEVWERLKEENFRDYSG